jgi:hypothetical protein
VASAQRHAPASLYSRGKVCLYPLDRRLGGPQSWSGHRVEEKSFAQVRIKGFVGPRHFSSLDPFGDSKTVVGTTVYSRLFGQMEGMR